MKTLLATVALMGALSGAALADHHEEANDDAENACAPAEEGEKAENACAPAEDDCSKLEAEAKTECEAKKAAEAKPEEVEEKGGKAMKKSNDGKMESYDSDE